MENSKGLYRGEELLLYKDKTYEPDSFPSSSSDFLK